MKSVERMIKTDVWCDVDRDLSPKLDIAVAMIGNKVSPECWVHAHIKGEMLERLYEKRL
jgi:hypothetical protein